ncbi:MAG TPA: hypothetical protein VKE51_28575 [Vicinamibacterales bacterium]|nr:hypothetical protein [Vicinamibacterales bacterium]
MTLELAEVRRIAEDVVRTEDPALEVIAATTEGGAAYTEVTVTIRGCEEGPCRLVIGADRGASESALRSSIASRLRDHHDHRRDRRATDIQRT